MRRKMGVSESLLRTRETLRVFLEKKEGWRVKKLYD
jgi:hypothetical protein